MEKRIEEGKGDVIKLKRDRNSLLNISKFAIPEILGNIFVWSLVREENQLYSRHFEEPPEGAYNFLLVCHRWLEVASQTPEVWSFWGNTLQDWKKLHHRSGATPLDLVLDGDRCVPGVRFDDSLSYAIKNRVMQDTIRQAHLRSNDSDTLKNIISALTPDDEGGRGENIESIIWDNTGSSFVDISDFFALTRLSKLRFLEVSGDFGISSWTGLVSGTTLLTTLSLGFGRSPPPLQLLSILGSNPNLQYLRLDITSGPAGLDEATFLVPLRNLKMLTLTGYARPLCGFLSRLVLPETLEEMDLTLSDPAMQDISRILEPQVKGHFRRDTRFQDELRVLFSSTDHSVSVSVVAVSSKAATPNGGSPSVSLKASLMDQPQATLQQLSLLLLPIIPREHVVSFHYSLGIELPAGLFFMMPKIEVLCLADGQLFKGFLQPKPRASKTNHFPSLRLLRLEHVEFPTDRHWDYLAKYLTRQISNGQITSLEVVGELPHMSPRVADEIYGLVAEFIHDDRQ